MTNRNDTPKYGTWPSKITAQLIVSDSISIDEPLVCSNSLYYIERRPQENGRCVIVEITNGISRDLLPPPYSARSRVHEYGGGCFCINDATSTSPVIYFINDSDQDIYSISNDNFSRITQSQNHRFADFSYDKKYHRLIAVAETHSVEKNITDNKINDNNTNDNKNGNSSSDTIVTNSIVSINISNGEISTLIEGDDFYASPGLNSTSTELCWQSWNHPNMPWDGNRLWLATIDNKGDLTDTKAIAGAESSSASQAISIFQPQWSPDDTLYFISDESGWWHIYRYLPDGLVNDMTNSRANDVTNALSSPTIQQLTYGEKEFGLPQWVFAQSTFAFINAQTIICYFQTGGTTHLATLSLNNLSANDTPLLSILDNDWCVFSNLRSHESKICFIAASSTCFPQLVTAELIDNKNKTLASEITSGITNRITSEIIKTTSHLPVEQNYYSIAQTIRFKNRHNQIVFANYYPPTNPDYSINDKQAPPLIIICHGGPTGQSGLALDPKKQFWTSRGFALLDVNYSGSTGYGKDYRLRLNGNWGKQDVDDCCDAAMYAVNQGLAHQDQLIIRGISAGGYTVLAALTFADIFSAGASYYGIADLASLANDTHKFEKHYLDRLIGPYPEEKNIYQQRSPINYTQQLNCPVIFFQGIEDRVVPKEQTEKMFTALKKKGLPVAAQYYNGEQHGFRKAETIVQSLENELRFYRLIFNLEESNTIEFLGDIQTSGLAFKR